MLGFLFGLSAGHAHDYINAFAHVLKRALDRMNKLPLETVENPEELSQVIEKNRDIIIDVAEMPCVRPQDRERQKEFYSGTKAAHSEVPGDL